MCPWDPLKSSKELIEERAIFWVGVRYTKGTVFSLRLSVLSVTLSLVGLQWKQVGGLWVSVLPPVHEVLAREQSGRVVYFLFNGSVLLFFRFVDESGTMFIRSLMDSSTSWGCLSVSDVPICNFCCCSRIFRVSWQWDVVPPHQSY